MSELKQDLESMLSTLTLENAWIREYLAATQTEDAENHAVDPWDDKATCWCMLGAIAKIVGPNPNSASWYLTSDTLNMPRAQAMQEAISDELYRRRGKRIPISGFNNYKGNSHQDVLDVIRGAINAVEDVQ